MANQFSFAPDPAGGWGGNGMMMGRALLASLTHGLNVMDAWDQMQRQYGTTPDWVGAQNAQNQASAAHQTVNNIYDQAQIGGQLKMLGIDPYSMGFHGIPQHAVVDQPQMPQPPGYPGMPAPAPPQGAVPTALNNSGLQAITGQYYSPWMGQY